MIAFVLALSLHFFFPHLSFQISLHVALYHNILQIRRVGLEAEKWNRLLQNLLDAVFDHHKAFWKIGHISSLYICPLIVYEYLTPTFQT